MAIGYDGALELLQMAMLNIPPSQAFGIEPHIGRCIPLPKGASVAECWEPGKGDYLLIEEGAFLLYAASSAGARYLLSIVGAGHVFTPQSMSQLLRGNYRIGVEAMLDVKLKMYSQEQWDAVSSERPDLNSWVIEQEAQQLQIVQFHLAQHSQRSSLDKTRFALCTYAIGLGLPLPCGSKSIKISRAELANWIGVSSDRMCRLIRELHASGEVTICGRSIKVSSGLMANLFPRHA